MAALTSSDAYERFIDQLEGWLYLLTTGQKRLDSIQREASFVLSDFDVNSSALTSDHEAILSELAATTILNQQPTTDDNTAISIEIEVDELVGRASQTGNEANNVELSRARAEAVQSRLADYGLTYYPAIVAHGSSTPLVDSARNEEAINRSVEIRMLVTLDTTPLMKELDHWEDVVQHEVPPDIEDDLGDRDIEVQTLDTADAWLESPKINLDFYQVKIAQMPEKSPGVTYTMLDLLNDIRLDMDNIISLWNVDSNPNVPIFYKLPMALPELLVTLGGHASLEPYSPADAVKWTSDQPLGAAMIFHTAAEDMGVVCSAYQDDYWIFSTIRDSRTPLVGAVGTHPVSGNRKFGYFQDASGDQVIYTKGADRTTGNLETTADFAVFHGGHLIWLSWQVGVKKFIESRGGKAEILQHLSNRSSYDEVKTHFFD